MKHFPSISGNRSWSVWALILNSLTNAFVTCSKRGVTEKGALCKACGVVLLLVTVYSIGALSAIRDIVAFPTHPAKQRFLHRQQSSGWLSSKVIEQSSCARMVVVTQPFERLTQHYYRARVQLATSCCPKRGDTHNRTTVAVPIHRAPLKLKTTPKFSPL